MGAKAKTGVSDFHYALLQSDDASGAVYSTPVPIPGLIEATITPNSQSTTLYADNGPYLVDTALGELKVDIDLADVPLDIQAVLLGHTVTAGVMHSKVTDTPPYVAIGWKGKNSNGHERWVWLLKGQFSELTDGYKTKAEKVDFQSQKLTYTAVQRVYDKEWKKTADQDHPDYTAAIGEGWFLDVNGTVIADIVAPTVTSVPTAGATGVSTSADLVFTFSEAIRANTAIGGNFMVYKTSDGSAVPGAVTLNEAKTVVTFNPTSALSSTTNYTAVISNAVCDVAGNALAAPVIITFTTGA